MWRRRELLFPLGLLGLLVLVALFARGGAPAEDGLDSQPSTRLAGPRGARGLAQILTRLGVRVEERRRALFDLASDSLPVDTSEVLILLSPVSPPTAPEIAALQRYVAQGGNLLIAGDAPEEPGTFTIGRRQHTLGCFGFEQVPADSAGGAVALDVDQSLHLDSAHSVLAPLDRDSDDTPEEPRPPAQVARLRWSHLAQETQCTELVPFDSDTLLATEDGQPVALDVWYDEDGGRVTLVSDVGYLSNRQLKETDAASVVIPWITDPSPSRVIFDEYHLGFGAGGSLWGAAWRWLWAAPAGWVILELALAGVVALATAAVRFGPPLAVIVRRRRSPLEHVDALALGLKRSGGYDTAVELVVRGLRRRLSGSVRRAGGGATQWLRALAQSPASREARGSLRTLAHLSADSGGDERVLAAARAVEDVWEAMRPQAKRG